jgi:hypothetical protein
LQEHRKLKFTSNLSDFLFGSIGAFAVFLTLFLLTQTFIGFSLAIVFGVLTFILYLSLSGHEFAIQIFRTRISSNKSLHVLTPALFVFSFLAVILVPSFSDMIFINWISIPIINWIRFVAGVSLVIFWPGYFILKLLDKKGYNINSVLDRTMLSFVIGIFIAIVLSVANIFWNHYFSTPFAEIAILGSNVFLFLLFLISSFKLVNRDEETEVVKARHRIDFSGLVLILLAIFFVLSYFFVYSSFGNITMMHGDLMNHHGVVLDILSNRVIDTISSYYPYYETNFASLIIMSGFPSANAATLFGFFNLFYVLSFYVMVRALVGKNSKIPALSTIVFVVFNGFEWIYAANLELSGNFSTLHSLLSYLGEKTWYGVVYSSFQQIYYYAPYTIAFISLFASIYIVKMTLDEDDLKYGYLILSLVAISVSIFIHILEGYVLGIFLFAFLLTTQRTKIKRIILLFLIYTSGFFAVIVVDSLLLAKVVIRPQIVYGLMLGSFFLLLSLIASNSHLSLESRIQSLIRKLGKYKLQLILLAVYFIGLSFLVWSASPLSLSYLLTQGWGTMPWYYYPLKLGVSSFLVLASIYLTNVSQGKEIQFLIFSVALIFISAIIISLVNTRFVWIGVEEERLFPHLFIPLSILAVYCLCELKKGIQSASLSFNRNGKVAKLVATALIALMVVSGTCTTILQVQFYSDEGKGSPYVNVSTQDFEVLNFVKNNLYGRILVLDTSPNASILCYKMYNLAGRTNGPRWAFCDDQLELNPSDMVNPETALYALRSYLNVSYLALLTSDLPRLNDTMPSDSFLGHLITYLPEVFNNSELTIFGVPNFLPPSLNAMITLAYPDSLYSWDRAVSLSMSSMSGRSIPADGDEWTEANVSVWNPVSATISLNKTSIKGVFSIQISSNSSLEFNAELCPSSFSAETYNVLRFYMYSAIGSPSIMLRIGTSQGDFFYKYLDFSPRPSGFAEITANVGPNSTGWRILGNPDWNNIQYVCFNIHSSTKNATVLLDGLSFIEVPNAAENTREQTSFFDVLSMVAQSNLSYDISKETDWSGQTSNMRNMTLVVPYDPNASDPVYTNFLNYATSGGNAVIINGLGNGGVAESLSLVAGNNELSANKIIYNGGELLLPQIHFSPLASTNPQIAPVAYYADNSQPVSGLLYHKSVGNGSVFYLNLFPYIQALESMPPNSSNKASLFSGLGYVFGVVEQALQVKASENNENVNRQDAIVKGNTFVNGAVNINSTSITIMHSQPINVDKIEVEPNNSSTGTALSNLRISAMEISGGSTSDLTINSSATRLLSVALGSYSAFEVLGGDLIFRLSNGAFVKLTAKTSSGQDETLIASNGTLTLLNASSVIVLAKSPYVTISGTTSFDQAFIYESAMRDLLAKQFQPIVFDGTIKFSSIYSDNNLLLLSDFGFQGNYNYPGAESPANPSLFYLEFTNIPWTLVMISLWHIVLISCIVILAIIVELLKYYHKLSN